MRQIHLWYNIEDEENIQWNTLGKALGKSNNNYDFWEGIEAYSHLLYWMLGGLNTKDPFNDDRLIGQVRTINTDYETTQSQNKKDLGKNSNQ